jgi:hypothetical protein
MANQYGPSPSPPWKFNPLFGDFVYKPSTDQIITPSGQLQPRPPNVPAASLAHAIWEGFPFTPQTPNASYGLFRPPVGGPQASQMRVAQIPQGRSDQPRIFPGAASQPNNSNMQQVTQGLRNHSIAASSHGNDVRTTKFQRNGQILKHTFDARRSVATLDVAPELATSQSSKGQTKDSRQRRGGKTEIGDIRFPDYRIHPARFFVVGRTFLVLWAEPAGGGGGTVASKFESVNQLGQRVYSKARRFVVVRQGAQCCHALPITTYGGRGVAKPKVVKADHAIIYTGLKVPIPGPGESPGPEEPPMRPIPIRVDWENPTEKLDPMSRINFGGVHLVQHNVMTKNCGIVNPNSLTALKAQFDNVFNQQPVVAGPSSARGPTRTNQRTGPSVGTMYGGSAFAAAATAGAAATEESDGESEVDEDESDQGESDDDEEEAEAVEGEVEDEDVDATEGNTAEEDSDSDDE